MTKAAFIKKDGHILPMDEDGREMMSALSEGKQIMVHFHAPRNVRHHRLLHSLLRLIVESGAWDGDHDNLLKWVKYETKLYDLFPMHDGTVSIELRSSNFESMSQDRFNPWFDRAIYVLSSKLLESEDWKSLKQEVFDAVDGEVGQRAKEHDERFGVTAA